MSIHEDSASEGSSLEGIPRNTNYEIPLDTASKKLTISSHGHKYGPLQPPADIQFNARSLPNPPRNIRHQTGQSKSLQQYLFNEKKVQDFINNAVAKIEELLKEKDQARVAVYCEMGKHRSVAVAERLAKYDWSMGRDLNVVLEHRDIDK